MILTADEEAKSLAKAYINASGETRIKLRENNQRSYCFLVASTDILYDDQKKVFKATIIQRNYLGQFSTGLFAANGFLKTCGGRWESDKGNRRFDNWETKCTLRESCETVEDAKAFIEEQIELLRGELEKASIKHKQALQYEPQKKVIFGDGTVEYYSELTDVDGQTQEDDEKPRKAQGTLRRFITRVWRWFLWAR